MLTDGVEDASTSTVSRTRMRMLKFSLNSCLDKKERCVSISGTRTRFSKYSMSGSPYFVDVELIQIEKNGIILCYVLLDH